MSRYTVVGSGVAGLYASLFLSKRGHQVTLLDQSKDLGGLLKSVPNEHGDSFDCGSHFLRDTGIPEIDNTLFKNLPDNWQRLPNLKIGTHFNGQYYDKSPFINTHHLSREDYNKGIVELLELPPYYDELTSCHDYLTKRFGPTFRDKLFREPLEKFYNEKIENLSPSASRAFDLVRLIALTPEVTREVKKSKWFDDRLAFHFYYEGPSQMSNYYPSSGGIGQWIDHIKKQLSQENVKLLLGENITQLEYKDKKISSYTTASGKTEKFDQLIWTVPQVQLVKLSGQSFSMPRPSIRTSVLIDLVVDKPFLTDVYYTVCYSAKYKAFRTFLYPNVNSEPVKNNRFRLCTEVMADLNKTDEVTEQSIFQELKDLTWIDPSAKLIYSRKRIEAAGFPVATNEFTHNMNELRQFVEQNYTNVISVGKASAKAFFMTETLIDTYKTLKNHFNEEVQ